jgi:epoxide hydrolase-like predicted phosphatase
MQLKEEPVAMAAQGIKAIVFDCFGVLYFDPRVSILQNVSPSIAVDLHDIFQQNNHGLLSREEYITAATSLTGQTREEFEEMSTGGYRLNTELIEKITELKKAHKVGLLSNIGRGWINSFFDEHQLHDLFDGVVLSGEVGIVKPQPEIYRLMADRLEVKPEECVFIDDAPDNCAGADAVGMKAIHYTSNRQCLTDLSQLLT